MNTDKHPRILVISGFDPSASAGLVADIETLHTLDCCASAVISCQTVQTAQNATACVPTDKTLFERQLYSLVDEYSFSAVKIGLTPSLEIIDLIADVLPQLSCPIVIDPVIVASGGYVFCNSKVVDRLAEKLIPLCDLATPNADELKQLAGLSKQPATTLLLERGCKAILVSSEYEKDDYLYHCLYRLDHPPQQFTAKCLPYRYRGSGCIFASAIAAHLGHGKALVSAIEHAQQFTYHCLLNATLLEHGVAIPQRFK